MAKQAVAKKKIQEVVLTNVDNLFEAHAGEGLATAPTDTVIPLLKIFQDQTKADIKQILVDKGGKPGDIFNNVTYDIFKGDEGVLVVPCGFNRRYLVWPGGTIEGGRPPIDVFSPADQLPETQLNVQNPDDRKLYIKGSSDGRYMEEQANNYVLIIKDDGGIEPAILVMKSSQFKNSRRWNSIINAQTRTGANGNIFTPPRWSNIYRIATTDETNAKGSFKGFVISHESQVSGDQLHLAERAKAFAETVEEDSVSDSSFNEESSSKPVAPDVNPISSVVD